LTTPGERNYELFPFQRGVQADGIARSQGDLPGAQEAGLRWTGKQAFMANIRFRERDLSGQ